MPKEAQSTQQFVEITKIKNGVVYLKSGGLRRVLMVSGTNFDLKSEEEQAVIIRSYQDFLNSLDFSLQIIIHSRKINIENYLNNLLERKIAEKNDLLREQISEYIAFIKDFVASNEIMAKNFFVAVPYDSITMPEGPKKILQSIPFLPKQAKNNKKQNKSLEDRIAQLDQRVEQVINGLGFVGLRVVPLNDEELIELFYNLYNPQAVEKKELQIAKK